MSSSSSSSGSGRTSPLILKITFGVLALEFTVIAFWNNPVLLVSYSTSIEPDSPGRIGFSGFLGIVQPQEEKILEKIRRKNSKSLGRSRD